MVVVRVDQDRCSGSGNCALVLPEVFDLDEDISRATVILATPPEELVQWARQAESQCPTKAIFIDEESDESSA
jgi:ferredoxin